MAKKELPSDTIVEVVLRKKMTYKSYLEMRSKDSKGWKIDAFQPGFLGKV